MTRHQRRWSASAPDLRLDVPTLEPEGHVVEQLSALARSARPAARTSSAARAGRRAGLAAFGVVVLVGGGAWGATAVIAQQDGHPHHPGPGPSSPHHERPSPDEQTSLQGRSAGSAPTSPDAVTVPSSPADRHQHVSSGGPDGPDSSGPDSDETAADDDRGDHAEDHQHSAQADDPHDEHESGNRSPHVGGRTSHESSSGDTHGGERADRTDDPADSEDSDDHGRDGRGRDRSGVSLPVGG